jgi:hypothetical protein
MNMLPATERERQPQYRISIDGEEFPFDLAPVQSGDVVVLRTEYRITDEMRDRITRFFDAHGKRVMVLVFGPSDDFAVFPRSEVARMAERLRIFLEETG